MTDTICLICGSPGHTSSSCQSEAAKALREKPQHTSRARISSPWPFGEGYQSVLLAQREADTKRGQHQRAKPPRTFSTEVIANPFETAKFAPKNPKAGKPVPGYRAPKGSK